MTSSIITTLILNTLGDYGIALLAILGAFVGIGVAYLVFRFGWKSLLAIFSETGGMSDRQAGQYYVKKYLARRSSGRRGGRRGGRRYRRRR